MKKTLLTPLLAVSLTATCVLQGQSLLYDGSSLTKAFGNGSASLVSPGSPNSGVDQAAQITIAGFGTYALESTETIAPNQIDWSAGDLTFDYASTTVDSDIYRVRLLVLQNGTDTQVAAWEGNISLVTDGSWQTQTIPIADWTTNYNDAVTNNIIDPTLPTIYRIFFQGHATGGTFTVDNFEVPTVPEPATYAMFFGLGALAFVVRRRMRK